MNTKVVEDNLNQQMLTASEKSMETDQSSMMNTTAENDEKDLEGLEKRKKINRIKEPSSFMISVILENRDNEDRRFIEEKKKAQITPLFDKFVTEETKSNNDEAGSSSTTSNIGDGGYDETSLKSSLSGPQLPNSVKDVQHASEKLTKRYKRKLPQGVSNKMLKLIEENDSYASYQMSIRRKRNPDPKYKF